MTNYEAMTAAELEKVLTDKERMFVHALLACGNQTQAAVAAGYSKKSAHVQASRMLKKDKVLAYKRACVKQIYAEKGITPETVLLKLAEIYERCMEAVPHETWDTAAKAYVADGTWVFDARGAVKALELMGKHMGMFAGNVALSGDVKIRYEVGGDVDELKQ